MKIARLRQVLIYSCFIGSVWGFGWVCGSSIRAVQPQRAYDLVWEKGGSIAILIHGVVVAEYKPEDGRIFQQLAGELPMPLGDSPTGYPADAGPLASGDSNRPDSAA